MKKFLFAVLALILASHAVEAHTLSVSVYDGTICGNPDSTTYWPTGAVVSLVNNDSGYAQTFVVTDQNKGVFTFTIQDNQGYMLEGGDNNTYYQNWIQVSGSAGDQTLIMVLNEVPSDPGN